MGKKNVSRFYIAKHSSHFLAKKKAVYCPQYIRKFNNYLTCFEQPSLTVKRCAKQAFCMPSEILLKFLRLKNKHSFFTFISLKNLHVLKFMEKKQ